MTFEVLTTTDECPEGYYAEVISKHGSCLHCAFFTTDSLCENNLNCTACARKDKLDVIFKPIKSKEN